MNEEMTIEEHVNLNFGIVDLYIFVECAGQYRVETKLRSAEGYVVVAETMYLGCCRELAVLAAFEVMLERATVYGLTEVAVGATNESGLGKWIRTRRNRADVEGDGFEAYVEDIFNALYAGHHLDALRIYDLYYYTRIGKGPRAPKVFTKIPAEYVEYIYEEESECTS